MRAKQFRPWPTTVPVMRDVAVIVPPDRDGAWAAIEGACLLCRSIFCPVAIVEFLRQDESVGLPGEMEYLFRVTYHAEDEQLTRERVSEAHAYLLGRVDAAMKEFAGRAT